MGPNLDYALPTNTYTDTTLPTRTNQRYQWLGEHFVGIKPHDLVGGNELFKIDAFHRTTLDEKSILSYNKSHIFTLKLTRLHLQKSHVVIAQHRGGSRISKGGVDGRPYLLRGGRENALTKKIGNNFTCTCLRRVFNFQIQSRCCTTVMLLVLQY